MPVTRATPAGPVRVLLVGDSHLARLGRRVALPGAAVTNRAVGGATTLDLPGQVDLPTLAEHDVVVVSVGTNDAAPWRQVSLADARGALAEFVGPVPGQVLLVTSPGVDEARLVRRRDRTNQRLAEYAAAFADVVRRRGGAVLDTPALLASLGVDAFVDDGVHLSPAGYGALVPALARAVTHEGPATS